MNRWNAAFATVACAAATMTLPGCAIAPDLGRPIRQVTPDQGYRLSHIDSERRRDDLLFMMSFSGGGTRAAAFSYGVLQQLAQDNVVHDGRRKRLLDELDVLSAVSGGGVTAAAYALHGDQIFADFEARFLKRDVQSMFWMALLNPYNLMRVASRRFARGDLFAEILDREMFEGATYGSLLTRHERPFTILNATDLGTTARVEFTQTRFDAFCLDLGPVPLARAVAASGASPPASTPITFRNYGGGCNLRSDTLGFTNQELERNPRLAALSREHTIYQDGSVKYLHLADGALSDNLGVRAIVDAITTLNGRSPDSDTLGIERPLRLAFVIVNASNQPGLAITGRARAPTELRAARLAAAAVIDRYSLENKLLLRSLVDSLVARLAPGRQVEVYWIEVDPVSLADERRRDALLRVPTNLRLRSGVVDELICSAREILARSADYRRLLRDLQADAPATPECLRQIR